MWHRFQAQQALLRHSFDGGRCKNRFTSHELTERANGVDTAPLFMDPRTRTGRLIRLGSPELALVWL